MQAGRWLLGRYLNDLRALPGVEVEEREGPFPHGFDALLQLTVGPQALMLCVRWSGTLDQTGIDHAALELDRFGLMMSFVDSVENAAVVAVLIAPAISAPLRSDLRQRKMAYFDLSGALFLAGNGIRISEVAAGAIGRGHHRVATCLVQ